MSSRRLEGMSSRHHQDMSSRRLQDMSSRRLLDMYSRRLQDISSRRLQLNNFLSSKTSSRQLGRRKIVTLKTCWRRLQDQQMFAGENGDLIPIPSICLTRRDIQNYVTVPVLNRSNMT